MRSWHVRRSRAAMAIAVALTLGGCGNGPSSSSAGTSPGASPGEEARPRIALVMKSLANEFFVTMADGAKQHHAAHATEYELTVNGIRNETDITQQVALVEQMVAQGVQAIVIAPADSRALVPVLRRAQQQGVVVVNIDNKLDPATLKDASLQIPFVGPDNRAGARAVGEVLARRLGKGDAVAILEGVPTAFNAQQRRLGFEDAMSAAGMRVVAVQGAHWEQDKANAVSAALLREHPDLKAILASNDNMALGAAAAVRQSGKTGQVFVVGFDNIAAVRQLLDEGRMLATADQHGDRLAVYGIEFAIRLLRKDAAPEDRQTPVDVVTRR
jgi:ribose transport system substrate-binding protein